MVLLAALIKTQLFTGGYFRALADGNRIREIPIHAPRGLIFDREGAALTANLPAFRFKTQAVSKDQAILLEAKGETPEIDSYRFYLKGKALSPVLGYVSEITAEELPGSNYILGDKIGRGGTEEAYEKRLRGQDGKELVEVDALGKKIRTLATTIPEPGENLTLTIDADLQQTAFRLIEDQKAAIVATNPQTGEVLILTSSPSFDANIFTDLSLPRAEREEKLTNIFANPNNPLFNRATGGTYPPGSTFKMVTATAGLETGKITKETTIDDPGILIIGPYKFPNWKYLKDGGTQGVVNVVSALQKSNDIFFYKVGEWVGIDGLVDWAKKFGLSRPLGIDLPGEAAGMIKNDRQWFLGDTYHMAIGQGDLLVTPLQVNAWTNVIANNGFLCKPYVLQADKGRKTDCREVGIEQNTIDLVKQGMKEACEPGGTGWPLFELKVACKTGTAEYNDPQNRTHAWFTVFAPIDKPEIALTVLIEGGGEGSDVAAPIAKKILEKYFYP